MALHALFAPIAAEPVEVAAFALFDANWSLVSLRHVCGTLSHVDVPLRRIAADAIIFDATGLVMAHNHPRGDLVFSGDDLALTRRLARGMDLLGVRLLDHLLLTTNGCISLRGLALI